MQAKTALRRAATVLLAAALPSQPAQARSIDYAALEQLFGEPVTTSVTGSPQRASEVPATMTIVTADDIRRSGARDITGVLRHVAGVEFMQWGADHSDLAVRGYNQALSPRLLVLLDGRQVYGDYHGYTQWATLPVELASIRQIEVVKGPNTALFGFNAVGGVINIITRDPLYEPVNHVGASVGNAGLKQGSVVRSLRWRDRAAVRMTAGGHLVEDFGREAPQAVAGSDTARRLVADIDGVIRLGERAQVGLTANTASSGDYLTGPDYHQYHTGTQVDSVRLWSNAETAIGLVQVNAYVNRMLSNTAVAGYAVSFDNRTTVLQAQDVFTVGEAHTLRLSTEYRHTQVPTAPFRGAEVWYDIYAAGAMWSWQVAPQLTWTNALRLDRLLLGRSGAAPDDYPYENADWNRTIEELTYNNGLVWQAGKLDTLHLTASRGVQLPTLFFFGAVLATQQGYGFTGSPFVSPTVVTTYELGWDHGFQRLPASLRASLFTLESEPLLYAGGLTVSEAGTFYVGPAQAGESNAFGAELELDGTWGAHGLWGLSYRFERLDDDFVAGAQNGVASTDFENVTARHLAKARLGWARDRWELDGYLIYQSGNSGLVPLTDVVGLTELVPIDAWLALDARVGYRLTETVTLALAGQNLGSSQQRQTAGAPVERRAYFSLSFDF